MTDIAVRSNQPPAMLGAYIPRQLADAERVAAMLANSGACGRMQPGGVFAVMMAGARYNLDPITATRTFFVADGRVGIYAAGMHGLILASGLCDDLRLVEDPAENGLQRAVWLCKYRGRPAQRIAFSQEDAVRAGLWGKKSRKGYDTPWTNYPDRMLTARALSKAARLVWPDVVAGLYTLDEIKAGDFDPDVIQAEFVDDAPATPARPPQRPAAAPGPTTPPTKPDRGPVDALPPYGAKFPTAWDIYTTMCEDVGIDPMRYATFAADAGGSDPSADGEGFARTGHLSYLRYGALVKLLQRTDYDPVKVATTLAQNVDTTDGEDYLNPECEGDMKPTAWEVIKATVKARLGGDL